MQPSCLSLSKNSRNITIIYYHYYYRAPPEVEKWLYNSEWLRLAFGPYLKNL